MFIERMAGGKSPEEAWISAAWSVNGAAHTGGEISWILDDLTGQLQDSVSTMPKKKKSSKTN